LEVGSRKSEADGIYCPSLSTSDFRLNKMSKEKNATVNSLFHELFQWNVYKRTQGRITRQVTFGVIAVVLLLGAWRFSVYMAGQPDWMRVGLPVAFVAAGWWIAFRLVNTPGFADFLIAVEAEMNKVTWPTRTELVRSSMVVIFTIFFLTLILFGYDLFWNILLKQVLHVLQDAPK
jgi:preprotein translocase subunit SecE